MKARTNERRSQQRAAELARGHDLLTRGERTEGKRAFGCAIRVTAAMSRQLMRELRRVRVAFMVAPYEADTRLSYLVREVLRRGDYSGLEPSRLPMPARAVQAGSCWSRTAHLV